MTMRPTPLPKRRKPAGFVIAIIATVAAALCAIGGLTIAAVSGDADSRNSLAPIVVPSASHQGVSPAKSTARPPSAPPLSAKTLRLTVKITSKQCFGSAGCNLEWQVRAAIQSGTRINGPCDVTYEVHGLTDTQTYSMSVDSDGRYEQDSYQSGQTSSSAKKLTAKVTEVECS